MLHEVGRERHVQKRSLETGELRRVETGCRLAHISEKNLILCGQLAMTEVK